jgi:hypothetical protein
MSILKERQKTHGEYADLAAVAQSLKESLRAAPNSHSLSSIQRESVELIATKLARIVCGNPDELDHWVDISGYADLVVFNLKDKNTAPGNPVNKETPDESSYIPDPDSRFSKHLVWSR